MKKFHNLLLLLFLINVFSVNAQSVSTQDSLALVAFYHAANGDEWFNNNNWLQSPVNSWHGVAVTYTNGIESINLDANNLTGTISPEVCKISSLRFISLIGNKLTGSLPEQIGNLTELVVLHLMSNQLSGNIPSSIGNCSNLRDILLIFNKFEGSIPAEIGNLENLYNLDLTINNLTGVLPSSLSNLENLKYLKLSGNNLSGNIIDGIGDLTKLEKLYLSSNNFTGAIPSTFSNLINLEEIDLSHNKLTNGLQSLENLNKVRVLDLSHNEIADKCSNVFYDSLRRVDLSNNEIFGNLPSGFYSANKLEKVVLSRNNFSGPIEPQISNLKQLTYLDFSINDFEGEIPTSLGDLVLMEYLNLLSNNLSGSIPESISNLVKLKELYLSSNELEGEIPASISGLTSLTKLQLGANNLSSTIPEEIAQLTNLKYLSLSNNELQGEVPASIAALKNLEELNISFNQLSGKFPEEIKELSSLKILNIGYNNLKNLYDLSEMESLTSFRISGNQFTFEDLEPNLNVITNNGWQQPFGKSDTIFFEEGERVVLQFDVGGEHNLYQWNKNSEKLTDQNTDSLVFANISMADSGRYHLSVTNELFPDFYGLTSRYIRVYPIEKACDFLTVSSSKSDASCYQFDDGAINLSVTHGFSPYSFNWSHGEETQNVSGLTAGNYKVVVTDTKGCKDSLNVIISEPSAISKPIVSIIEQNKKEATLTSNYDDGNQWFKDGFAIENETNQQIIVSEIGNFSVQVTFNNCKSEMSDIINIITNLSPDIDSDLIIFPNPAKDKITIKNYNAYTKYQLLNLDGKLIKSGDLQHGKSASISLTEFGKGTYIIKLMDLGETITKKIIIE